MLIWGAKCNHPPGHSDILVREQCGVEFLPHPIYAHTAQRTA